MKTFIVLGMHRSATSLISKGLHQQQVPMADKGFMMPAAPSNSKGHFEDNRFVRLNEAILRAAGGGWAQPPEEKRILERGKAFLPRIKTLIENASARKQLWGWKDPRTTLTIKLYMPFLTNPHFICCFRNPTEIAKSLKRRGDLPIPKGIQLAKIYNERLLNFLKETYLENVEIKEDIPVEESNQLTKLLHEFTLNPEKISLEKQISEILIKEGVKDGPKLDTTVKLIKNYIEDTGQVPPWYEKSIANLL